MPSDCKETRPRRPWRPRRVRRFLLAVCVTPLGVGAVAVGDGPPTFLYALQDASAYTEGCFGVPGQVPQCMCPILLAPAFSGTFGLTNVPDGDPLLNAFEITNVQWTATLGTTLSFTGSGLYEVGATPDGTPVHRMTLELLVNGEGPVVFDSGLVPGGDSSNPPVIDIGIGDGFGCPGRRMSLAAAPDTPNPADVAPPGGDGAVGIQDLLAVLGDWGLAAPRVTDIDGSGWVGIGDLLIVLAEWTV